MGSRRAEDPPESRAQEAEGAGVAGEGGGRLLARGKVRAEIVRVPVHRRHRVRPVARRPRCSHPAIRVISVLNSEGERMLSFAA